MSRRSGRWDHDPNFSSLSDSKKVRMCPQKSQEIWLRSEGGGT